jgi:hypothetical protein
VTEYAADIGRMTQFADEIRRLSGQVQGKIDVVRALAGGHDADFGTDSTGQAYLTRYGQVTGSMMDAFTGFQSAIDAAADTVSSSAAGMNHVDGQVGDAIDSAGRSGNGSGSGIGNSGGIRG